MLIVPLSPDLRVGYRPVITITIVVLCIVLHIFHVESQKRIEEAAISYCEKLPDPWLPTTSEYLIDAGLEECGETLSLLYRLDGRYFISDYLRDAYVDPDENEFAEELERLLEHYDGFSATAPRSMKAEMIYHPDSPNPIRMLTSGFLHADWSHVIFNMIFFLAFATALEVLIGNALLYIGIMATISIVSGVAYSLYTFLFDYPYPSLGFSDVVMGMIGLSAYLMPRARIRTFIWLGFWAWILYVPAWIFATWYIGRDIFDLLMDGNEGGTNIVAHVSGALTGYYLGRKWLSDRKWLIEVELQDEIEHMKASRGNWLGVPSLRLNQRTFKEAKSADDLRVHEREFDDVLCQAHKLNETHEYSEALNVLLAGIKRYGESEEVLKDVFATSLRWTRSLFTLRFARHYITYLLAHGKRKEALNVCETCFTFAPEFILARALDVMPLAHLAFQQQRYQLAYSLVHDSEDRYGDSLNTTDAKLLEARMLVSHLDRPDDAHSVLESLKRDVDSPRKCEIFALDSAIAPLLG
jgi:membrane associated rhomboid family serine protease